MTWTKLDDGFWMHPKVIVAGNTGAGIYARMLAYCGCYLSDGEVPAQIVTTIVGRDKSALDQLAASGLVKVSPADGSVVIPDFLEFNPSREDVQSKRRKDSERQAQRRRSGVRSDTERTPDGHRTESAKSPSGLARGGPQALPVPSRPDHFPPSPPQAGGHRKRDLVKQKEATAEWELNRRRFAAEHFPDLHPDAVLNTAKRLEQRRVEPTVAAIRAELEAAA